MAGASTRTAVRHIEVEGYDLTICGTAVLNGEQADAVVDGRSVVLAGETADDLIASAFAAGLHMHETAVESDGNVTTMPRNVPTCPLLEGDGQPQREEPWQSSGT